MNYITRTTMEEAARTATAQWLFENRYTDRHLSIWDDCPISNQMHNDDWNKAYKIVTAINAKSLVRFWNNPQRKAAT